MQTSKTITDPLYGTIALSKTESAIVSTRTFQRLHNVRQLGLAYLVFPSSGYSRFAHSVGALHNAARMVDAINSNCDSPISRERRAAYRMAALLHDVGHYPFSHTTEHALKDYYASGLLEGLMDEGERNYSAVNHEEVGGLILRLDPEISGILEKADDIDLDLVSAIFSKSGLDPLFGIISSELDCDRLDYLRRTSLLSGVPYGTVDVDFIVNKATLGSSGELAFDRKASKAIDHLLLSRYFDYMQMVFHKTVEGLEWSLEECIKYAVQGEHGLLSQEDVEKRISRETWWRIDDSWLLSKFKDLERRAESGAGMQVRRDHLAAVLYRRPAKRVWKWEAVKPRDDKEQRTQTKAAQQAIEYISSKKGIDPHRFKIKKRSFGITKLSGSDISHEYFDEEKARSIKIQRGEETHLLLQDDSLLLKPLSSHKNFSVNVYYLPATGEDKKVRDEIRETLHSRLK